MSGRGNRVSWRLIVLALLFASGAVGLVGRLAYLQIVHHGYYAQEAEQEHLSRQTVRPTRGAILDRNGYPLATSLDAFDLYIERRAWQNQPSAHQWAEDIAPLVDESADDILEGVDAEPEGDYTLALALDYDKGQSVIDLGVPGLKAVPSTRRFYPEGDLASALLGFIGRDHVGLAGLEADLQEELAGTPGDLYFERDSLGNPIPFGSQRGRAPVPGGDVRLTIDRYIQRLVEEELDRQVEKHSASGGTIIVMDPQTGAILAMASRPTFRVSHLDLSGDVDPALFRNRAVTDVYEPGSVMKVITMATAVDLGLVNANTTYYDAGYASVGGYTIYNWDYSTNGTQTTTELLQKSLNTGAIWLSSLIGADNFYSYLYRFGFGESTNSGFGGEAAGLVRSSDEEGWYPVDLATNSFGQGIAATPLQVITAVATIANGGKLMRPYIVQEVAGPQGRRVYEPVVVRQPISESTARTVAQMMNAVVEGVPYHLARVHGYHVGGKTGTTIVSIPGGYDLNSTIASFVGFAPVENPKMIMLVKIDQPKDDPLGGQVAAPVFGTLAPEILAYLDVKPDALELVQGGTQEP
jgi:stage V sporulation protein D (sporulation-specific penicillin-binding protein)